MMGGGKLPGTARWFESLGLKPGWLHARLAASRARSGIVMLAPADATVEALRRLVEDNFRRERQISFYAGMLAMTPDRLNDHVKRATGVTAGHGHRRRILRTVRRR